MIFSAQGTALSSEKNLGSTVESTPFVSVTIIPKKSFFYDVCMYTGVLLGMRVGVHVDLPHACTGKRAALDGVLQEVSTLCFETGSLIGSWDSHIKVEWLRSKTKGSAFLCPHSTENINTHYCTWLFLGATECQMQVFILWQWERCCLVQLLFHDS